MGVQKRIRLVGAKTAFTCPGLQTTTSHVRRYSAENGNFWKFWCTFHFGTMFVPKQLLYQKEAAGMESPKMYSSSWCKNGTYLYGPANHSISCEAVYDWERKFVEVRVYLSPWYRIYTKPLFNIKRKLLVCRVQKCIPLVGTKTALTCAGMQTTTSRVRRYKAENGNFWKFWSTSPWYHVCTKAIFISKGSYRYGIYKNVFLSPVQKPHLPVRTCKLPHLMWSRLQPRTEISGSSDVPFTTVPCLHQSNLYIKRKLRVWRV